MAALSAALSDLLSDIYNKEDNDERCKSEGVFGGRNAQTVGILADTSIFPILDNLTARRRRCSFLRLRIDGWFPR